ncbi:MAG TPA: hypothetical protein VK911_02180 [Vicinamibacterales bacterium]|nr:hypothetical protein [Vicinamibacterales bacterium]
MIGKVVRIAIALLVINGTWRAGSGYWTNYQFEDRLTQIIQFGDRRPERELCEQAVTAAAELHVPVAPENIRIRRAQNQPFACGKGYAAGVPATAGGAHKLSVEATYTRDIAILPGYAHRFTFHPSVEVWARLY